MSYNVIKVEIGEFNKLIYRSLFVFKIICWESK